MKSSTAAPSFRNSGFDTTANGVADAARRKLLGDRLADAVGGAHRHRGLVDDDLVLGHPPADVARRGEHVLHVRRAVLVRRRAHGDELQRAVRDRGVLIGGEAQAAARRRCAATIASSPGSWMGTPPRDRISILQRVDVEAQHVVADLGEAGSGDEPDIARPDHRDLHAAADSEALIAASAATGSGA